MTRSGKDSSVLPSVATSVKAKPGNHLLGPLLTGNSTCWRSGVCQVRDFHAGSKAGSQGSMNDVIEGSSIMIVMTEMTT